MKQSFTVLSEKLLNRLLDTQSQKVRYNSGTNPVAQIENLLHTGSNSGRPIGVSDTQLEAIQRQDPQLYWLLQFLLSSACRISEALAIEPWDITENGMVKINTLKRGKPRIVHAGSAMKFLLDCKRNSLKPWKEFNRFYVHRQFKKYGIETHLPGRKKKTVTHLPRHYVAKQIQKAGMEIQLSQQALGQSSVKSTRYYHESEPKK